MTAEPAPPPTSDDRVPSGIAGLDTILHGGFLRGGITIVQGKPGSGKTILGNQLCFNHARSGGRALYVTLLAESHSRMLMHMGGLGFYDIALVPGSVYYISAFPVLEADGLPGLLRLLRQEVRTHGATMLVLDGLVAAEHSAGSDMAFKKFIHELQTQAGIADCAMFLLTSSGSDEDLVTAEHTMVDCVISVRSRLFNWQAERHLEVLKRRGGDHVRGRHAFSITGEGFVVFPRIEAVLRLPSQQDRLTGRLLSTGLPTLDGMMGGGLPPCSATLLVGPPGTGKTTLGLHFLGGCTAEEPGLHLSFYESPEALRAKAEAFGLPAARLAAEGHIAFHWQPVTEALLDRTCAELLLQVRSRRVRRLVVDGLGGLVRLAPKPDRVVHIFAALANELRALGVGSVFTTETDDIVTTKGPSSALPPANVLSIAENVVLLRCVTVRSQLARLLSVLKVRDAKVDTRMRAYDLTQEGLVLDHNPDRAEAILTEASVGAQQQSHASSEASSPRDR